MLFEKQLQASPDELALTDTRKSRTWRELQHNVLAIRSRLLNDFQLKPDQHIALLIGNQLEFIEAMLAGICSGLWVTPINTHLSESERRYILEDCDASLLLYSSDFEDFARSTFTCKAINIDTLIKELSEKEMLAIPDDAKAGGTMLYTSGTTGKPKGVRRNKAEFLRNALKNMQEGAKSFGLTGAGPHLITGPLYHAAPMLFALYDMLNGASVIIMPKWDSEHFIELLNEYQVVTTHLVPTMFVRLLHLHENNPIPEEKFQSLKLVLHGAAPIAPSVKQRMIKWWGPILVEYWGASEAGTSTLVSSEEWLAHPGTVGKALPHLEIFIGDENGNPVEDETGMLFCRNKKLAQVFEYHKAPEKTREAHPQPHTFCIGDIGRIDSEGFVYLSDRKSNMIISGGVNIYPAEIEQALIEHPDIADLAVFGVPDEEWGESVKALIELKNFSKANQETVNNIKAFARERIANYKVPRFIEFTEQLPRNAAGKVRIHELK